MDVFVGTGIDIIDIDRVRHARHLQRVMEFFLTARELGEALQAADPAQFAASRFAAKEAVIKAFPHSLKPHDFEVVRAGVKPGIRFLHAEAQKFSAHISIAHASRYAISAACVFEHAEYAQ